MPRLIRPTVRNMLRALLLLPPTIPMLFYYITTQSDAELYENKGLPWWHWDSPRDVSESKVSPNLKFAANKLSTLRNSPQKIILYNHRPFDFDWADWTVEEDDCGVKCLVTYESTLYRDKADAVLFHCVELDEESIAVNPSHASQLLVFLCQESPWSTYLYRPRTLRRFENVFNLTMTYRRDSDFLIPYGNAFAAARAVNNNPEMQNLDAFIRNKSRHSIWIVSNCGRTKGSFHRVSMVRQLVLAGLRVDLRGTCFDNALDQDSMVDHISQYKFYLAFENAFHCRDYVTEKVWKNSFEAGAVPVVWGPRKTDVEDILPPGSYIMVEDFSSPSELVKYLNFLDRNNDEYRKYFTWWDSSHRPKEAPLLRECALCHAMHSGVFDDPAAARVVPSVDDWWFHTESRTCTHVATAAEEASFRSSLRFLRNSTMSFMTVFWYTFVLELLLILLFTSCKCI